jgi:anaerobic selenocysteine-containing dehydrogenase
MRTAHTYCRICVASCGVLVDVDESGDLPVITRVRGDAAHPLSGGYTCPKGRGLGVAHHGAGRLDAPALGRAGSRHTVPWDAVMDDLASRLTAIIRESGPDSVAVFSGSGAVDSAGALIARRLMSAIGTRSIYSALTIDAPAKPYVGALMAGNPAIFGAGPDIERSTLTLLVGSNPVVSHGHTNALPNPRERLRRLRDNGELWVVDPRRTATAAMATRHISPRPGTDHIWLAAVVREALGWTDDEELSTRAHGITTLRAAVADITLERAASECDLPLADLTDLVGTIRRHGRFAGLTGTGVTMSRYGHLAHWLLTALLVVTDSADAPGGTLFNPGFIRGSDRLPWRSTPFQPGTGPTSRPDLPRQFGEQPAGALAREMATGGIRALLVVGGNLANCLPGAEHAHEALSGVEVLATLDITRTETTDLATHLLPCTGPLERSDITLGTDQYLPAVAAQHTPPVVASGADRRHMWRILAELGARLGHDLLPDGMGLDDDPDLLFEEAMGGARADFATLRHERVLVEDPMPVGWVREGVRARGGWDLAPAPLVSLLADAAAASTASTGERLELAPLRELDHMNAQLTEGRHAAYLNPADAARLHVLDGEEVTLRSAAGTLTTRVHCDERVRVGVVGVPHGYELANVNDLTSDDDLDPLTGMPVLSGIGVHLAPAGTSSTVRRSPTPPEALA